jgi:hypothetical protein
VTVRDRFRQRGGTDCATTDGSVPQVGASGVGASAVDERATGSLG